MPRLSGNRVDALGRRMRGSETMSEADLGLFEQLLGEYAEALDEVNDALREMGLDGHPRMKSTDVTREKLRRDGVSLRGIHDLAGTRVVKRMTLDEQDQIVEQIRSRCPGARERDPIDRRRDPNHGYRAVHVICRMDGRWVEIQVRTFYQDTWAQLMERMGDLYGRQIRYGDPPNNPQSVLPGGITSQALVSSMLVMSGEIANLEESENTTSPNDDHPVRKFLYSMRETLNMPEVP